MEQGVKMGNKNVKGGQALTGKRTAAPFFSPAVIQAGQLRRKPFAERDAVSIQRQEAEEGPSPGSALPAPWQFRPSADPDFLSMRQPFVNRSVFDLWDPDAALEVWQYNFDFFRRFGLSPDFSATLTNITAPRFIDAQLKLNNPTWWEITDLELNTSTIGASLPLLEFNADFSLAAPSWFKSIFQGGGTIQRKCGSCNPPGLPNAAVEQSLVARQGRGKPLPDGARDFMEQRMGADFSQVRIHADPKAEQLSQKLNAQAFTYGSDIYFNRGKFSPQTSGGKRLLAHELTHVIQQQGSVQRVQRYSEPGLWCNSLVDLVNYEEQHGKLNTLVEYNSFDNEDLVPLNYNIPSIYGEVDVDWMLRLAVIQYPFIVGSIFTPSMSEGFGSVFSRLGYLALKSFWIAIDPRAENWNWASLTEEGNWNSSPVVIHWIHGAESLRTIFAPALELCENYSGSGTTKEPTY
ncbi:MAG TPA: DUF4157 domain-containing protein [Anseongella sp.]|nr:DUF4157 domain-containing protein [Anseongella sp.]